MWWYMWNVTPFVLAENWTIPRYSHDVPIWIVHTQTTSYAGRIQFIFLLLIRRSNCFVSWCIELTKIIACAFEIVCYFSPTVRTLDTITETLFFVFRRKLQRTLQNNAHVHTQHLIFKTIIIFRNKIYIQTNHENIFHFGRNQKSVNIRSTASLLEYLGYEMKCSPPKE